MKKSKLIILLKSLENHEVRYFKKYIKSPCFTQSKDVLKLYNYIHSYYPSFESPKLEKIKVFGFLYPNENFNGPRLRNLMLKITKILEDFLIYLECQQTNIKKQQFLTDIYRKRNLNDVFSSQAKEFLSELEKQPIQDSIYFYNKFILQRDMYFNSNAMREGEIKAIIKNSYQNLNYFFALERMRLGMELKTREKIFPEEYTEFQVKALTFHPPKESQIYNLFQKVIELIESQDEQIYFDLKPVFYSTIDKIHYEDQQRIIYCLVNFTLNQISKKGSLFIEETNELFKKGLKQKLFFNQDDSFNTVTFLNIVLVSSSLKEFDWTKDFIVNYAPKLKSSEAEYLKPFAMANLYFYQDDFQETINIIQSNKFSESIIEINSKLLVLRAYYELAILDTNYLQLFNSCLKNYEKYLSRQYKLDEIKIKGYMNFIMIFKKYLKIKTKVIKGIKCSESLESLLNTTSPISAKPWLKAKVEILKNENRGLF